MNGHDRIIDRFVSGSMSRAEEQEFHRLLESDSELRELYDSEQILNRTMLKERDLLSSVDHSATYSRFLAGLAVPAANTAPEPLLESSDIRKPWYVPTAARTIVASTVTALLVIGALMLNSSSGDHSSNAPSVSATPSASAPRVRTTAPPSPTEPRSVSTQTIAPSEQNVAISPADAASPDMPESTPQSGVASSSARRAAVRPLAPIGAKPSAPTSAKETNDDWTSAKSNRPPVFRDDSVKVNVNSVQP